MIRTLIAALIITLFPTTVFTEKGEVEGSAAVFVASREDSDWEISNHVDMGFAEAAVPGKITYGDMQRFHFFHGQCNVVRQQSVIPSNE